MSQLSQTESRQLGLFRRQYLQLMSTELLTMPPSASLRNSGFQAQLFEEMYRSDSLPYAIPHRYKLRVLKELMKRIEDAMIDPEEDVCFPCINIPADNNCIYLYTK